MHAVMPGAICRSGAALTVERLETGQLQLLLAGRLRLGEMGGCGRESIIRGAGEWWEGVTLVGEYVHLCVNLSLK